MVYDHPASYTNVSVEDYYSAACIRTLKIASPTKKTPPAAAGGGGGTVEEQTVKGEGGAG